MLGCAQVYEAGNDFVADVHLVFDNAMTFNAPETEFHMYARWVEERPMMWTSILVKMCVLWMVTRSHPRSSVCVCVRVCVTTHSHTTATPLISNARSTSNSVTKRSTSWTECSKQQ